MGHSTLGNQEGDSSNACRLRLLCGCAVLGVSRPEQRFQLYLQHQCCLARAVAAGSFPKPTSRSHSQQRQKPGCPPTRSGSAAYWHRTRRMRPAEGTLGVKGGDERTLLSSPTSSNQYCLCALLTTITPSLKTSPFFSSYSLLLQEMPVCACRVYLRGERPRC